MGLKKNYATFYQMYLDGLKTEEFVMKIIENQLNGICTKASLYEDRHEHIDFHCLLPNGEHLDVDVKGVRKNARTDNNVDDSINWIEYTNVKGNPGWIYGKATHIAFVTNTQTIFVKRENLVKFAEECIRNKDIVFKLPTECYVPYQRSRRLDLITKIYTKDLIPLADFILENNTN